MRCATPSNRSGLHNTTTKKKKHRSSLPHVLASTSAAPGWDDLMLLSQLQHNNTILGHTRLGWGGVAAGIAPPSRPTPVAGGRRQPCDDRAHRPARRHLRQRAHRATTPAAAMHTRRAVFTRLAWHESPTDSSQPVEYPAIAQPAGKSRQ